MWLPLLLFSSCFNQLTLKLARMPSAPVLILSDVDDEAGEVNLRWTSSTNSPNWYEVTYRKNDSVFTKRPSPETSLAIELLESTDGLSRGVEYEVYVRAHNTKGYSEKSNVISFTLTDESENQTPWVICTECPIIGEVGQAVNFLYVTKDPQSDWTKHEIIWGDEPYEVSLDGYQFYGNSGRGAWHIYNTAGTYHVRGIVMDTSGNMSNEIIHTIEIVEAGESPESFKTSFLLGNPDTYSPATGSAGFGVNTVTGNFHYAVNDISIPGKDIDFVFERFYNSQKQGGQDSIGEVVPEHLAIGWSHSYNIYLRWSGSKAEIVWGDGSRDGFLKKDSLWAAETPGNSYELTQTGSSWVITSWNNTEYHFDSTGRLGSIKSRHGNDLTFDYYDGDYLKQVTDTAGRKIVFGYGGTSRLTSVWFPDGTSIKYEYGYNTHNQYFLKSVTDRNGNTHRYVYQEGLLRVIHRAGVSESAAGDNNKILLQITYDSEGRVIQQDTGHTLTVDGAGTYSFGWGESTMTYNSPSGQGAMYEWDDSFRLTKITPINSPTDAVPREFTYSREGIYALQPDALQDSKGQLSDLSYVSGSFELESITDTAGRKSNFIYNEQHDLNKVSTPSGLTVDINWSGLLPKKIAYTGNGIGDSVTASFTHTDDGQVGSVIQGSRKVIISSYHSDGQPLSIQYRDASDKLLGTINYTYDLVGRMKSVYNSLSESYTCYNYDGVGNPINIISGVDSCFFSLAFLESTDSISIIKNEFDADNRLIKQITAYGSDQAQTYTREYSDKSGALSKECHSAGGQSRCKTYKYTNDMTVYEIEEEETGRKHRIHTLQSGALRTVSQNAAESDRRIERRLHDANGNLVTVSSCQSMEAGNITNPYADCASHQVRLRYEYDTLNRPTKEYTQLSDSVRRVTTINYSADGRTVAMIKPEGNRTVREVDSLGRLIRVTQADQSTAMTTRYEYDDNNNLIKITDPSKHTTLFTYDALGRITSRTDLSGTQMWEYPDGLTTVNTKQDGSKITYYYNAIGNLLKVTTSDDFSVDYTYNALGQITTSKWEGYGKSGERYYRYTAFGEVESITSPTGEVIEYDYDSVGRLTSKRYAGVDLRYEYNGLDQLKALKGLAGNFTFYHDAFNGALLKKVFPNAVETTYQRNLAGELIKLTTNYGDDKLLDYNLSLDGNGRRVGIQGEQPQAIQTEAENLTFTFTDTGLISKLNNQSVGYDARGNLTSIPTPYSQAYVYDVWNRLKSQNNIQHEYDDSRRRVAKTQDGKTTRYLWDVMTTFGDIVAELDDTEVSRRYVYGPGGLLAQIGKEGVVNYVHQDFNHNIMALTNSDAKVTDSFAWTPLGRAAGRSGTTDIPFGFAGGVGVMTDSTDSIYMRARHYHTGLRQFTSPDLVEGNLSRPQSLNRYSYVEGMAFSGVDPSGLCVSEEDYDKFSGVIHKNNSQGRFARLLISNQRRYRDIDKAKVLLGMFNRELCKQMILDMSSQSGYVIKNHKLIDVTIDEFVNETIDEFVNENEFNPSVSTQSYKANTFKYGSGETVQPFKTNSFKYGSGVQLKPYKKLNPNYGPNAVQPSNDVKTYLDYENLNPAIGIQRLIKIHSTGRCNPTSPNADVWTNC